MGNISTNGTITASSFIGNATSASYLSAGGLQNATSRDYSYTQALRTGGWNGDSAGYKSTWGTFLDVSGYSTWYHRLAFNTNGHIDYYHGINTTTMSYIGRLLTSANYSSYALPLSGGTITGQLKVTPQSGSWLGAAQGGSAIQVVSGNFTPWIGGYTKNGGMTIATYPYSDDKMYIGYCATSTTTNAFDNKWQFNGSNGIFWSKTVSTNKLIVSTTSYGSTLPSETVAGTMFFKLV